MSKAITRIQVILAFVVLLAPGLLHAQIIFLEDFDGIGGPTAGGAGTYTFPAGWFLRNVDNFTPNASVAYVNDAWERREDFSFAVGDSAAFSTSWYTPTGVANDWMWTPLTSTALPAGAFLYWNAVTYDPAYPDGYEVRIMTQASGPPSGGSGLIGNQISNSTVLFSTTAENSTWTARNVSLAAYAGQRVYIGFRNNSNDKFLLLIDDVRIEAPINNDAEMVAADTLEYSIMPLRQAQAAAIPFNGTIRNGGANNLTGAYMMVNVYDGLGNLTWTGSSTPGGSLAPGGTQNATVTGWTPSVADFYTFEYISKHSVADGQPADDTLYRSLLIDTDIYARDDGNVTGGVGIGAGNGWVGQEFDIYAGDIIDSVLIYVTRGYTGKKMVLSVYPMVAGTPSTTAIAATDTITYLDDSARVYVLSMAGGGWAATPGTYVIGMVELDSTIQLGQTASIFTPGDHWVYWSTIPSAPNPSNLEVFGGSFARASVIRPYFNCGDYELSFNNAAAGCGAATGASTVSIAAGGSTLGTPSYLWSNGSTSASISGVVAGTYTVTVTIGGTCQVVQSTTINNAGAGTVDSVIVSDALCNGDLGSIELVITGGTAPYTYAWSNGSTSPLLSANAGSYSVTVTDTAGCIITSGPYVLGEPFALALTVTTTNETSTGASDGTATANVSGGTGAYTYLWNNGQTGATATGLSPGSYCVTVTDANACVIDTCTDVITSLVASSVSEPLTMGLYPSQSSGVFQVFINSMDPTTMYVEVIDGTGRVIWSAREENVNHLKREISLDVADGIYFVRASALDRAQVRKIVVKR